MPSLLTPPKWPDRLGQLSIRHAAFVFRLQARPSELLICEAIIAFTVVTAWGLATFPRKVLSIGFRILVSRHPAIQATGLLTLTPAGVW
jgi:hypothetical protein